MFERSRERREHVVFSKAESICVHSESGENVIMKKGSMCSNVYVGRESLSFIWRLMRDCLRLKKYIHKSLKFSLGHF